MNRLNKILIMLDRGSLEEKFSGFGSEPSEGLWDSIASTLDQKPKRRRGIIWWTFGTGIAAALLILLRFTVFSPEQFTPLNSSEHHTSPISQSDDKTSVEPVNPINNSAHEAKSHPEQPQHAVQLVQPENNAVQPQNHLTNLPQTVQPVVEKPQIAPHPKQKLVLPLEKPQSPSLTATLASMPIDKMTSQNTPLLAFNHPSVSRETRIVPKAKQSKWEFMSELQHDARLGKGPEFNSVLTTINPGNSFTGNPDIVDTTSTVTDLSEIESIPPTYIKVSRPFRLHAELAYHISPKFYIKSGLQLAWVKARYNVDDITINLVSAGLPLEAGYQFITAQRWDMTVAAGFIFERPIFENKHQLSTYNVAMKTVENNFAPVTSNTNATNLELGLNYSLTETLKLNFSPGFKWYYSQSPDHPYNFLNQSKYFTAGFGIKKLL